jgi:hypothetical protein
MVHINRSKKTNQFIVITTGANNEKLNSSELVKTKQSAWVNIKADLKVKNSPSAHVQDNTGKKPVLYWLCFQDGKFVKSLANTTVKPLEPAPQVK